MAGKWVILPVRVPTEYSNFAVSVSSEYVIPLAIGLSCGAIILILVLLIIIVTCLICRASRWAELWGRSTIPSSSV